MPIGVDRTAVCINNLRVELDLLKSTCNKEQAIDEQRDLFDKLTDFIGWTNHDKVIGALFDIVKPKDSRTFERGMLMLDSFVFKNEKKAFRDKLVSELKQDVKGNSTVTVSLGSLKLTEITFSGAFTFCDRLFTQADKEGTYKLNIPAEFNMLVANLKYIDIFKEGKIKDLKNHLFNLLAGNSTAMFCMFKENIHRAVGFLPEKAQSGVLTQSDFLKRIKAIFGDLVEIKGNNISFSFKAEGFETLFEKLSNDDKAFLLIVVNQNFKAPLEGMASLLKLNSLFMDDESEKNLTEIEENKGLVGGEISWDFQLAPSSADTVRIEVSSHVNFNLAYDFFPTGQEIAAHQKVVGTYEVFFNKKGKVKDIQFTYSDFNLVVHNKDESAPDYPVLKAESEWKILSELNEVREFSAPGYADCICLDYSFIYPSLFKIPIL